MAAVLHARVLLWMQFCARSVIGFLPPMSLRLMIDAVYFCADFSVFVEHQLMMSLFAVYPETKGVPLEEMDAVRSQTLRLRRQRRRRLTVLCLRFLAKRR